MGEAKTFAGLREAGFLTDPYASIPAKGRAPNPAHQPGRQPKDGARQGHENTMGR